MRERLIELILNCDMENNVLNCYHERPRTIQAAEIIADYLLENGVVVLPCKVGDVVYIIDECSECTYHTFDRDDLSHFNFCPECGARMDGDEDEL